MRQRIFSWGGLVVVLLMATWFYLGAMWGMEENARVKAAPTVTVQWVDQRAMHCFRARDRSLCQVELQQWDLRWQYKP